MRVWIALGIIYGLFFTWYTDLGGKLSADEIQSYISQLQNNTKQDNLPAEGAERLLTNMTKFMEEDTGKQFLMVNIIDMSENPTFNDGTSSDQSADELMNKYMEHMYPELFKRASHPVYVGNAISNSVDIVGIANAEVWERAVLMRYKSRRAFMEIIANPEILGEHKYKIAAVNKTIAFPAESAIFFGDVRLIFGLILLIIGLLVRSRARK